MMNSTTTIINIFAFTVAYSGILPGDLTDCLDPTNITDPSCVGGIAPIASIMRHSRARGDGPAFYPPGLDRETKFVQMHPEGWGVNKLVSHDFFGWNTFIPSGTLFSDVRLDSTDLLTKDFSPVMTNLNVPPTSKWTDYLHYVYFDDETGAAMIHIAAETQPLATSSVDSMVAALDYIAQVNKNNEAACMSREHDDGDGISKIFTQTGSGARDDDADADDSTSTTSKRCWAPILCFFEDDEELTEACLQAFLAHSSPPILFPSSKRCWAPIVSFAEDDEELTEACLQAALAHTSPPILFHDSHTSKFTPELVNNNRTVVVTLDLRTVSHLRLEIYRANNHWIIRNFTLEIVDIEENLPSEYKDAEYIEDLKYLRTLADEALTNDPVVGTSTFMPVARRLFPVRYHQCMGGECPIGNLFTDALRWASDADFAVAPSGGLRGEGWPAGEVHVSDLWRALPFVNYKCTGVMSGVSVFRLLNYSTSVATFESAYTKMGDRLLQLSGIKMTYNTLMKGSGSDRLVSVDVWDREKEEYLPLERLKLYRFASDSWMCDHFHPYPSLFRSELRMEGEVAGTLDKDRVMQDIVGSYLTSLNGTYNTSIRGSHINDTEAFEPLMAFIQTEDSCLIDQFWEVKALTCKSCPGGKYVKFSEDLISFLITPNSRDFSGRNILSNRELFNVTLAPRSIPTWIVFGESTNDLMKVSTVLQPGDSIAIDFDIDALALGRGSTRSTISFGVVLDGHYPGCLTDLDITFDAVVEVRSEENFNHLDNIRPVGLTLMAFSMGLSVFFFLWTYKKRRHRIVKVSQPDFLQLICAGTFIMAMCIVPLSIDDSNASQEGCDKACMAAPWLFSMGFAITFSALFAKIWRIHKVISNAKRMRRVVVQERDALKPIAVVFGLNFVLLLCWTLIDPMRWRREYINGDPTNSHGFCKSEGKAFIVFLTLLVLVDGAALVLACVQAYRTREMDDEFTESRWLAVACASWIQVLVVGVPVILLTRNQPVALYFTHTAMVFSVCVSMLLLLFLPKMKLMSMPQEIPSQIYQPNRNNPTKRNYDLNKICTWKKETLDTSRPNEVEHLKQQIHELEEQLQERTERPAERSTIVTFVKSKVEHDEGESKAIEENELNQV